MSAYTIGITNECEVPRFNIALLRNRFKPMTLSMAEKTARIWNRHAAIYNRAMKQNVVYTVVDWVNTEANSYGVSCLDCGEFITACKCEG